MGDVIDFVPKGDDDELDDSCKEALEQALLWIEYAMEYYDDQSIEWTGLNETTKLLIALAYKVKPSSTGRSPTL